MININPKVLGHLEVGWWRAHNEHDKQKMLDLLIKFNVEIYFFTPDEALEALIHLVKGVGYHDNREWTKTVESVTLYYEKVQRKLKIPFLPRKLAELEVEWWRLHDELEHNSDKTLLAHAFTKLYAALFNLREDQLRSAGKLKAQATYEHDLAEDPNTPKDKIEYHWKRAEGYLVSFYSELEKILAV